MPVFEDGAGFEDVAQAPDGPLAKLALLVEHNWEPFDANPDSEVLDFLATVKAVGREEDLVKVRIGRLLAWANGQDVGPAGYPDWTAFTDALSPWLGSRTRDYVRLFKSRLDVIKDAVSNGVITPTLATRAPSALGDDATTDAQHEWLYDAAFAASSKRRRADMDVLWGDEMRRVLRGRELGTILIGWRAPMSAIDDFLIDCLEQGLTGEQILERARAKPPKPERLGGTVPEWKDEPSVSLLGPWVEPRDIHEAVVRLKALKVFLDKRRALLGMAYYLIQYHALWSSVPGCNSLEELCVSYLKIGQQTLQRCAHDGLNLFFYPEVKRTIDEGRLSYDQAAFALDHAGGPVSLGRWLELVRRLSRVELARAQDRDVDLLEEYRPALEMARDVESIVRKAKDGGMGAAADQASAIGGTAARIAEHLLAVGATGEIEVAIRDDANRKTSYPEPEYIFAPPRLLAACDYILAQIELPRLYGPRQIVEHDMRICQHPRCRRPTIRLHPHHLERQVDGGSDDKVNLLGLCPACHLRGVHTKNWLRVVRIEDWIVFTYLDGSVTLMHSPVAWLEEEVQVSG
jgi:hypothetical protein